MTSLWASVTRAGGARLYALAIGTLTFVLSSRWIGPEGRGLATAATTWAALFGTASYLSLGQVALHRAANRRDENWLPATLGSLLLLAAGISVLGWLAALALYRLSGGAFFKGLPPGLLALGFAVLPLFIWELYGSYLLIAIDRLATYNKALVVGRSVALAGAVVFIIGLGWGAYGAVAAYLCGQCVVALTGLRLLWRQAAGRVAPRLAVIRELLAGGWRLHPNALGIFLLSSSDVLVIQHFLGEGPTGLYAIAVRLCNVMLVLPQAAAMVLYGHVATQGAAGAWPSQRRALMVTSALMLGAAVAAALLAPLLIPTVLGTDFAQAVPLFQLLLLTLPAKTVFSLMAPQWIGRGLFWQASTLALLLGGLNLGANLLLVPRYGVDAAIWSSVACYNLMGLANLVLARLLARESASLPVEPPQPGAST